MGAKAGQAQIPRLGTSIPRHVMTSEKYGLLFLQGLILKVIITTKYLRAYYWFRGAYAAIRTHSENIFLKSNKK